MPPKKKQKTGKPPPTQPPLPSHDLPVLPLSKWGRKESPQNANAGFCRLPDELISEVLSYYPEVGPLTSAVDGTARYQAREPILPVSYLVRPDTLRALSQTCVAYRRLFLPILWERLEVCVEARGKEQFFRHAGESLTRKCNGLLENPDLLDMVRYVNVILTRYKSDMVLPTFTKCLKAMPNVHTIHVLHAHTQMTSHIKAGFEGVSLPTIRTLIIPGYCHELLKTCPEVRSVQCIRDDGSKLITVIKRDCPKVEEVRGFGLDASLTKRLVKAAPNLRTVEVYYNRDSSDIDGMITELKKLKHLTTIDIFYHSSIDNFDASKSKIVQQLKPVLSQSPSKEKKYLRLCQRECLREGGHVKYRNVELED
ncbi:hypothetical protein CC1G_00530 [Coprinopsis cinerea okayama7|uniref:F-box domain-containing protein n=1 Tax=Coprinopsis cinerea (strain Okayama-7 / 130 / ATCC MYA-4618 / FGSC 9003) TaxID=240176 RepID=A8N3A6_COPC7|nr:hypothetical protein CC1G_00530 [Coprinopsis cinerea okayama7\|eukprot:XP_001829351.1 hypothetical protein CC1G_00530 [Coprinopsis cinerea okayama7\